MITIIEQHTTVSVDTAWLTSLVEHLLTELSYQDYVIGILLTSNKEMQQYNETYRHKKGPTDILSFSYHQLTPGQRIEPETDDDKNLGDLILAPAYIKTYTDQERIPFEQRIMLLLIHGICHLLGYDHETDEDHEKMQALEDRLLKSIPKTLQR